METDESKALSGKKWAVGNPTDHGQLPGSVDLGVAAMTPRTTRTLARQLGARYPEGLGEFLIEKKRGKGGLMNKDNPPTRVRSMLDFDLDDVVGIHRNAFAGFFLTRMGPRFLRAYYQTVLDFDASISLVACDVETHRPVGFAVGFRDPQGFYALFSRRKRRLVLAILVAVLRDPGLLSGILRNTRRVGAQARQPVDAVELSSIAVTQAGRGIGGALLEAFAAAAQAGGATRLVLTTDEAGNDPVRAFYEGCGFTLDRIEERGERRLCCYVRALG